MLAASVRVAGAAFGAEVFRAVVEQHAEDAAFLFTLRRAAVAAPHTRLEDLARLDERLEANLDGLRIAGRGGAKLALRALDGGDEGEVFVAAVLACEAPAERMPRVVAAASTADRARGLAGALAWVPFDAAAEAIAAVRATGGRWARDAALSALAAHRRDPKGALESALLDPDPRLRATALRAIGALGRRDRGAALAAGMQSSERECRASAAWSAVLLGDRVGIPVLRAIAAGGGPLAEEAATLAAIALPPADAAAFVEDLARPAATRRAAARAAAALGDPAGVAMLLAWCAEPELARVAADAVTTITGIGVVGDLAGEPPEGFVSGPSDEPEDEDVTPDADEHLAWPQPDALAEAWERARGAFLPGVRHVLGRVVSLESLRAALVAGRQVERARAAIELARAGEPLFDVAAPAHRQLPALEAMGARVPSIAGSYA